MQQQSLVVANKKAVYWRKEWPFSAPRVCFRVFLLRLLCTSPPPPFSHPVLGAVPLPYSAPAAPRAYSSLTDDAVRGGSRLVRPVQCLLWKRAVRGRGMMIFLPGDQKMLETVSRTHVLCTDPLSLRCTVGCTP